MRCCSASKSSPAVGGDDDLAVEDAALGQLGLHRLDELGEVAGHRPLVAAAELDLVAVAEDDAAEAVPLRLVRGARRDGLAPTWPASGATGGMTGSFMALIVAAAGSAGTARRPPRAGRSGRSARERGHGAPAVMRAGPGPASSGVSDRHSSSTTPGRPRARRTRSGRPRTGCGGSPRSSRAARTRAGSTSSSPQIATSATCSSARRTLGRRRGAGQHDRAGVGRGGD